MTAAKIRLTQPVFLMRYSATRSGKAAAPFKKSTGSRPARPNRRFTAPFCPQRLCQPRAKLLTGITMGSSSASSCGAKRPLAHTSAANNANAKSRQSPTVRKSTVLPSACRNTAVPHSSRKFCSPAKCGCATPCVNVKNTLTANGTA